MEKMISFLFILCLTAIYSCKPATIPYGNNPAVGKYYNIRGFKMYCEIYGEGEPLLMIHGNGGNMSAFKKNVPCFSKKYKVILADSRAQGKSTDYKDSLSFEMMADDFAALLDTLQIKKAYVIGWSDGGINALLLAMRHPDKVVKLASTGANLWPDSTAIMLDAWLDEQKYYNKFKHTNWTNAEDKNKWKIFMLDWQQPNIPLAALKSIMCPSLIICGDHDVITRKHTLLISKNIPDAKLWVVPNSGHATFKEHTDEFNKQVDAFFSH